ncbi:MAG: D-glycerate dehydrogenase [Candidatus Kaiserbacteria bacterium]|nr:D-glycerate dehydrogenase [Candidatus Kaiserbacteria bacterium]
MKVLITHSIPGNGVSLLRGHNIEVRVLEKKKVRKGDLIATLKKEAYDGMISLLTDTIDEEVLSAVGSQMKVIANYAVGFNNIAVKKAKEQGIVVTNTPGVLTETVAEHTFALILAVATRVVEADAFVRAKQFTGWEPELLLGVDLLGKTLGIIGAGRIGSRVAEIGNAFGMEVVYHDMQKNKALEEKIDAEYCGSPDEVLRRSAVVSVHLPLTDTTYHCIDAQKLSLMRSDAILVNTSRGPVIDEKALISTLRQRKIFGAGLDVFEHEPAVPAALRKLPNVVLTPHTASASIATRGEMAKIAVENVLAVLHGGKAPNEV